MPPVYYSRENILERVCLFLLDLEMFFLEFATSAAGCRNIPVGLTCTMTKFIIEGKIDIYKCKYWIYIYLRSPSIWNWDGPFPSCASSQLVLKSVASCVRTSKPWRCWLQRYSTCCSCLMSSSTFLILSWIFACCSRVDGLGAPRGTTRDHTL